MTRALAKRGYDMIGVDGSEDMLSEAYIKGDDEDIRGVLYLCQDMRSFELYGTVGATVCCLDSINYLMTEKDVEKTFSLVHNYSDPEALFLFDVNSPYKFENIYADISYVMEEQGAMCIWQNYYSSSTNKCNFYISLFEEREDGLYERYDEEQTERMYTIRSVKKHLEDNSLEYIGAFSNYGFTPATDDDERIYIVAKCKK
jgi:hypothetical protein